MIRFKTKYGTDNQLTIASQINVLRLIWTTDWTIPANGRIYTRSSDLSGWERGRELGILEMNEDWDGRDAVAIKPRAWDVSGNGISVWEWSLISSQLPRDIQRVSTLCIRYYASPIYTTDTYVLCGIYHRWRERTKVDLFCVFCSALLNGSKRNNNLYSRAIMSHT
jgi:hypothetical protein